MNLLPCDAINYFINFLCLDDMKDFGLVCKDFHAITSRSPTYFASILSTFYTGRPPVNEEDNQFIRWRISQIFQEIIDKKIFIERPFLIQGKQLQDLPVTIRQNPSAKLSLKLLVKDLQDIDCATEPENEVLLPLVQTLEFSDEPSLEDSDDSWKMDSSEEDERDEKLEKQHKKFIPLLEKMSKLETLIFYDTSIDIIDNKVPHLKPYSSIKELYVNKIFNLFNFENADRFLELFPNVEKIGISKLYNFCPNPRRSIAKASVVKELFFFDSSVNAETFESLLICLPKVAKLVFHRPFNIEKLLQGFTRKPSDPLPSVKELRIFEPAYKRADDKVKYKEMPLNQEYLLKKLSPSFPNLEKLEITISEDKL